MDLNHLIHMFMSTVITPIVLVSVCLILSPLCIFKFMLSILRYLSSENMTEKVVLITGASSGIGEQLAYEYAKKGASLVIVARRKNLLLQVSERARRLGSPDVLLVCADVSNINDCKRFVDEAINHFGRLDHLVNNAGISSVWLVEDAPDVSKFEPVMDVNFWGSIYTTYYAIPHLKKTKGKIVVNSSASALLNPPSLGIYSASKAALISFYETMRVELAPEITITIVTPGFVESEIVTQGKHLSKEGVVEKNPELRNLILQTLIPIMNTGLCAKGIVDGACRGERYVTEPPWFSVFLLVKVLCPEVIEWYYLKVYKYPKPSIHERDTPSYVASILPSEIKAD